MYACVCVCTFVSIGLTWLFAFFAVDKVALPFQILFCIFNSLQGFLLFLLLYIRDKSMREALEKLLSRCFAKFRSNKDVKCCQSDGSHSKSSSTSNVLHDMSSSTDCHSHSSHDQSSHDDGFNENIPEVKRNNSSLHEEHVASEYKESPAEEYITRYNSVYAPNV